MDFDAEANPDPQAESVDMLHAIFPDADPDSVRNTALFLLTPGSS